MRFPPSAPTFGIVGLSLNQKRALYRQLAQLLRSGRPLPAALDLLASSSSGKLRRFQKSLQEDLAAGDSVEEAFAQQGSAVSQLEVSMLSAGGRSGRLMESCEELANYFDALERARAAILKKCAYPLFVFHFGVFILGVPTLVGQGGLEAYFKQTATTLGFAYACALGPAFIIWNLLAIAQTSSLLDRLFLAIPAVGRVRRCFALARFCATYDAQLDAGVNVIESLKTAADASRSAVITKAIHKNLPLLREGAQVGEILEKTGIFPESLMRAFRVAEATGGLDRELPLMARELEEQALSRVETLSEWVPRMVYVAVMVLVGWKIVSVYQGVAASYGKLLEGN